ncbi:MAG TPA: autotransporter domain-containing protein [Xanthomonadaceae bacterium]
MLLLIGGTWSRQASAAVAICTLDPGTFPTSQTGAGNSQLSFSFLATNGFACNVASGNVAIQAGSDTTGGASITLGNTFSDASGPAGGAPFTNVFDVQLGPNPGSVNIVITCTAGCNGGTTTLTYTASSVGIASMSFTAPQPAITGPTAGGLPVLGDTLTYTLTAANTGSQELQTIVIDDQSLTLTKRCVRVLPPTGQCVLTATHVVSAADAGAGSYMNSVLATATPLVGSNLVQSASVVTSIANPSLTIAEGQPANADNDGSNSVTQNDVLTYTTTVTNTGNVPLTTVAVSDSFGSKTCGTVSNLAPNNTCVLTTTHTVSQGDVTAGSVGDQDSVTSNEVPGPTTSAAVSTTVVSTPSLTLAKALSPSFVDNDQSGSITPGDVLTYSFTVTNTGNVTLNTVTVTDPLMPGFTGTCTNIPRQGLPGNTCTVTTTYTVTAGDAKAGSITNTAHAATTQLPGITTPSNTVVTPVTAARPALTLAKAQTSYADNDGNSHVSAGDVLTYTFTVTNTGNVQLNQVTVTDPLMPGFTGTCTNIPRSTLPGNTCTLTSTYTVTAADAKAGRIVNQASAATPQLAGVAIPSNQVTTQVFTITMGVQKLLTHNVDGDHSGTVTVGDVLTFSVTATNSGNATLSSVTVGDPLTAPNTTTCTNVAPGGTCVLNGIYTVTSADLRNGAITNTGTASSPLIRASVSSTLVTSVFSTPGMTISKVLTSNADGDGSGTVTVGDVLTFTVTATNSGNVALTNVVVTDPLTTPNSFTCKTVNVGNPCALVGKYTVTAADAKNGAISNTGTASAKELTRPIQTTLRTPVSRNAPAMTVTKLLAHNADGDHSGTVTQGDVLTYTVTATNSGTAILGNVQVNDPLTSPGTITCPTLAVGASCVLTGNYTVTAADVSNGTISNTGKATSNQVQAGVVSNTITTPVVTTTALSVTKVLSANADGDGSGNVTAGDKLTYTVTATNTGNVLLNTVTVNDPLTAPNQNSCGNVQPNGSCVLTGTYTVTTADASKGSISNTGSASAPGQINTPVTQTLSTQVFALNRTIAIAGGDGQSGPQNSALKPLLVSVLNNGHAATGATVNWAVTSGTATLLNATTTVGGNGQSNNTLTLGASPGAVTVTATRADDTTQSVTFHETITAPVLSPVSGNNQIGVVGSDAVEHLVVHLVDGNGNPFANQTINWQVVSGPATFASSTSATSLTGGNGDAQIAFSYGANTGAIVIRASYGGSTVDFNESSQAYRISVSRGNNQTAAPGQPLPQDFLVTVAFPTGMTTSISTPGAHVHAAPSVANVPVQWSVLAGGGSLSRGNNTQTDPSGQTSNHYTLGTGAGLNQVQVTAPGGTSVTFTANSAATNATLQVVSGNNQTLVPGTTSAPMVVLLTSNGIPLANVTVSWTAVNANLTAPTSRTDGSGHASNTATVTNIGPATLTASTSAPVASPVTFALNGGLSGIAGLTPIEGQITGALDNACPALAALTSLTPAQQDLLKQCQALASSAGPNPGQTVTAINEMFSDSAFLETSAAMLISTAQFDNIKARIAALRSGTGGDHFGGLAFTSPDGSLPVGSLGTSAFGFADAGKDDKKQDVGSDFDRWGFFLSGTFTHGSSDPRESLPGYGFNTNGVTAGVDYRFSDKFIFGVSAGYAKYDSSLDAGAGGMNTNGWTLSAYSTLFQKDNWYVDGVLSWGSNSYDISRKIVYTLTSNSGTTTVNQTANGSDSGNTLAAAVTFGRDFNKGPWSFGPYFRGTWTRVDFDGYQEVLDPNQPGSGLGLSVQTHPLRSTASVLGAKLNYASSQSWGVMMPHAEVEWQHEFQDNPDSVTARFLQDPTQTPITADGFPVDQDFFRLGLGVSFVLPRGKSGFIYYEKTLGRTGITQDSIALGMRIEF